MPWREVKPMNEKILFVADYLRGGNSFSVLCSHYGISRKTGYKWVGCYQQKGIDGLSEQSHCPKTPPLETPYPIRQAIIKLRERWKQMGPKKILALLAEQFPGELLSSKTTIYNILNEEGLVKKRHTRRRVPPHPQPFASVHAPNELWSADFEGQFKMCNGIWCYPLTIMDHDSRFLLGCDGFEGTRFLESKQSFMQVFKEYGLPQRIRTDNGTPFASRSAGGLSSLSIWWIRLGIIPERIKLGRPQQNGRHERMHRTLKQAVTQQPPAANFKVQQKRFDQFCQEYNYKRPHEALGQVPPASCYQPSSNPFLDKLPELEYPDYYMVRKVHSPGIAYWNGKYVYTSHLLKGEKVGMTEVDDGIWDVYFGPVRIGSFNERNQKGRSVPYLTLKVLPMYLN